jgi:hypothetical protein
LDTWRDPKGKKQVMNNIYTYICCCSLDRSKYEAKKTFELMLELDTNFMHMMNTLLLNSYMVQEFFSHSSIFNVSNHVDGQIAWPPEFIKFIHEKRVKPSKHWLSNHVRVSILDEATIIKYHFGELIHNHYLDCRRKINNLVNPKYV